MNNDVPSLGFTGGGGSTIRTPTGRHTRPGLVRRLLVTLFGLLVIAGLLVIIGGLLLGSRVLRAVEVTRPVIAAANQQDLLAACRLLPAAAEAWNAASAFSRPLAPVLHVLGWVPRVGSDLRIAPDAVALARSSTSAGTSACRIVEPALASTAGTNRIASLVQHLATEPGDLTNILVQLQQANTSYQALAPYLDRSVQLAPYRDQLTAVGTQLPRAITALAPAYQLQERLPWLFGLDEPRRYLLALQNPFELRATGGFIGLVCSLRVEQAQLKIESCRPSEAYDVPAPSSMEMPAPYARYLRLGNYYLRDANWAPDFPTTAQRLQEFWQLNGQPSADGVVAVDIYALIPLLEATGDITLENGSVISADQVVNSLLSRYYDDTVYRDKVGIGELLPPFVERLFSSDAAQLRAIAGALQTAITERHIQVAVNDRAAMTVLRKQGWTGSIGKVDGDVVRVVDTDVGYGGVNAFIDRLTSYDVYLDAQGAPVSSTLTLTYTNRYSPWAEATTAQAVFGNCTDPRTLQLERRTGCYANYIRVYVPEGSVLNASEGLEEPFEPDQRYGRTVFGGYVRINPGEQRMIRFTYELPGTKAGAIRIEKQPGIDKPAIAVTVHHEGNSSSIWSSLSTDRQYSYAITDNEITIDGVGDDEARIPFTQASAFKTGLEQWRAGDQAGALATWDGSQALDLVLDHARALDAQGATEDALALLQEVTPAVDNGRGLFEQAMILAQRRDPGATALYEQAAAVRPEHPLAQLMWGYHVALQSQPVPELVIGPNTSAVRRWRNFIIQAQRTGAVEQEIAALAVLLKVAPDDRILALRHADLLLQIERREEAFARYNALAQVDDIWGLLAAGRYAQLNGQAAEATGLFVRAITMAPDESSATRVADALRNLGDLVNAQRAYERALEMSPVAIPTSIRPLLASGMAMRSSDPDGARGAYEQARELAPDSGYPDYAIGRLLLERNDPAGALPFFEAAMEKEPTVRLYSDVRDVAAQQANGPTPHGQN